MRWDNFLVSLVEQEVAYQATWSDNVIWWRGANPQKAATTGGVVEAIYGSLGWKWSGQIHDERVLDRKEVQGGLVHKGWKEKRDALVQQHNRAYRKQRDQAQRGDGGDGDGGGGEDGGEDDGAGVPRQRRSGADGGEVLRHRDCELRRRQEDGAVRRAGGEGGVRPLVRRVRGGAVGRKVEFRKRRFNRPCCGIRNRHPWRYAVP